MPVVTIKIKRLKKLISDIRVDTALEMLPFIGLDIEGVDKETIRAEYNPNRPDLSSDIGIARALRGLLEIETGLPKFKLAGKSGIAIRVQGSMCKVRPYIVAFAANDGMLQDETLKQLISMQEDLHNGIGRKRRKASIGIHNLDVITSPITYKTVTGDYSFRPLNESSDFSIDCILSDLEIGKQYGHILADFDRYPLLIDNAGTVLSFPPIINGQATRVTDNCSNLFVEVTAIDEDTAEDLLAILAITLYDAGFDINSVNIESGKKTSKTPRMTQKVISADVSYLNNILGLSLGAKQMVHCLKKSRLDASIRNRKNIICTIPRYRIDINHPIDIAEELAIGYGIYNLEPSFPASYSVGEKNSLSVHFNAIRESLIGLGMIESLNFLLTSKEVQYDTFDAPPPKDPLFVETSKSIEHELLRDSLIPVLLKSLSYNIHEQYPQKLFEIGKTFLKSNRLIEERWSVGVVIANTESGYTEIKSAMQALFRSCFGREAITTPSTNHMFMKGRSARVIFEGKSVGIIGEITPLALEKLKLRMPVAAFEINLLPTIKDK
ncbi:MAG: phenylalanine--tRNA ligase subunit beta [Nitrososphaera sp.]